LDELALNQKPTVRLAAVTGEMVFFHATIDPTDCRLANAVVSGRFNPVGV